MAPPSVGSSGADLNAGLRALRTGAGRAHGRPAASGTIPRMGSWFVISETVATALAERRPVVALESTVVTHGLPHPEGVETALALEALVREAGAVPATVGVLDGAVRVGLERPALERLATASGTVKLNPGNLAAQLA